MKNFDERIRDKVYGAEMPVSDKLWNAIDAELDKKERKPGIWLMVLVPLFLIPIGLISWHFQKGENHHKDSFTDIELDSSKLFAEVLPDEVLNVKAESSTKKLLSPIHKLYKKDLKALLSNNENARLNLSFQISTKYLNKTNIEVKSINSSESMGTQPLEKVNLIAWEPNPLQNLFSSGAQCPQFRNRGPEFYILANTTSSYSFQSLSSLELDDYIQQRNATESGTVSYSADIGIGLDFRNGYYVETGLMLDQINVKFNHKETVVRNTSFIRIDTFYNEHGDIVDIKQSVGNEQEIGVKETKALNKFRQIDLPLRIGYRFPVTSSFDLAVSGGIVFNLRSYNSGKQVDRFENIISYNRDNSNIQLYKTRLGLSYISSIKLEKQINDQFLINGGLDLRLYTGNFNLSTNLIDQNYFKLGISAGVRYRI